MYFLYSSGVVAPIHCISPRDRAGLSILEASTEPSAAPAPISVCSSSIKRIILSDWMISFITILSLSSNWPLYLVPAINAPRSRETMRLPNRLSGMSPETIFWASPSTIAVFPTPGSAIITGLFLILLPSIWIRRSISSSLLITGSSFPPFARSVRSLPNSSSAGVVLLFSLIYVCVLMEKLIVSCLAPRRLAPKFRNILPPMPSSSLIRPRRMCSLPI